MTNAAKQQNSRKSLTTLANDAPRAAPHANGLPRSEAHARTVAKTWQRPPGSMVTVGAVATAQH